jgi:hypothetical protein
MFRRRCSHTHTPTHPYTHTGLLLIALSLSCCAEAWAQGADDRIFPPGGQRGTTVSLTIPAMAKEESATLLIEGEGVRALGPFVKGVGQVEIAPDAEPGLRQVRLVGPKSATAPRPFMVGTLPEFLEKEPNDTGEQAQRIESLPVVLNGSLPKPPDTDLYRLSLKKGDFLVVAAESRRTASPSNLTLYVRSPAGTRVPVQTDVRRRDPVFTCPIPADGEYQLQLHEITNNMGDINEGYHYRLTLTTGPWIDYVFPAGAARGQTSRHTVRGWNFGGKPGPGELTADVTIPSDAADELPLSAGSAPNRFTLAIGSRPEVLENEPNSGSGGPQALTLPVTVNGTLPRGDRDAFQVVLRKGQTLRLDVEARDLDSFADPVLSILSAEGKFLERSDDAEASRDPRLIWTAPADGAYTLALKDIAGEARGGPEFYYRLTLEDVTPELRLTARDATVSIKPGAKAELNVAVYQSYQAGEVTLTVEGLPPGVTVEPVKVPASPKRTNTTQAKIVLTAAADAKPGFAPVRVVGTAAGDAPLRAEALWRITGDGGWSYGTGAATRILVLIPAP